MSDRNVKLEVNEKESAIILREDYKIELCLPKMNDDTEATTNQLFMVVLAILLNEGNEDLTKIITKKMDEICEESPSD